MFCLFSRKKEKSLFHEPTTKKNKQEYSSASFKEYITIIKKHIAQFIPQYLTTNYEKKSYNFLSSSPEPKKSAQKCKKKIHPAFFKDAFIIDEINVLSFLWSQSYRHKRKIALLLYSDHFTVVLNCYIATVSNQYTTAILQGDMFL